MRPIIPVLVTLIALAVPAQGKKIDDADNLIAKASVADVVAKIKTSPMPNGVVVVSTEAVTFEPYHPRSGIFHLYKSDPTILQQQSDTDDAYLVATISRTGVIYTIKFSGSRVKESAFNIIATGPNGTNPLNFKHSIVSQNCVSAGYTHTTQGNIYHGVSCRNTWEYDIDFPQSQIEQLAARDIIDRFSPLAIYLDVSDKPAYKIFPSEAAGLLESVRQIRSH